MKLIRLFEAMKISGCTIYALRIPFVEAFSHSAKSHSSSDSIVVRLEAEDGSTGYGEGVARPFVTGETVDTAIAHIENVLWPAVAAHDYKELATGGDSLDALAPLDGSLPDTTSNGVISFNAARCAVELALVDCLLRSQKKSLTEIIPARRSTVTYSGVITSGSTEGCARRARQLKLFGIREIKIKIVDERSRERVHAVRETLGASAKLRVDANGAFDVPAAISIAKDLYALGVEAFEQPVPRTSGPEELAEVRAQGRVPVMADESLVTIEDARSLIRTRAIDWLNLRLSKCGGLWRTLQLAQLARMEGLRFQLGSQVGETAILSAAGRHVAFHLHDAEFVEGSYGRLLLTEDVAHEPVQFGHGGRAHALRGHGLGVSVREDVLERRAHRKIHLRKR